MSFPVSRIFRLNPRSKISSTLDASSKLLCVSSTYSDFRHLYSTRSTTNLLSATYFHFNNNNDQSSSSSSISKHQQQQPYLQQKRLQTNTVSQTDETQNMKNKNENENENENDDNNINDFSENVESGKIKMIKGLDLPQYRLNKKYLINTRRTSALYDSQYNNNNNNNTDSNFINLERKKNLTHNEKKKRQSFLRSHSERMKTEYQISKELQRKYNKKLSVKLEKEQPLHHRAFTRIYYEPSFPDKFEPTDVSKLDPTARHTPVPWDRLRTGVIAQKVGMMTLFDKNGIHRPITILRMDSVQVVQFKNEQHPKRGTYKLQLGYGSKKIHNFNWSELGHFSKHNVPPKYKLWEFHVGKDALLPVGTEITCQHFMVGQYVDIKGISKGKGFQGVMKRWNMKGGPATHGSTKFHRKRGSFGGCNDPGKVWKGTRMPGNMGNKLHTTSCVRVFRIEPRQNLVYIWGSVAGPNGGLVKIRDAHFLPPKNPPFPTFFSDPEKELPEFEQWVPTKNQWFNNETDSEQWLDKPLPDLK